MEKMEKLIELLNEYSKKKHNLAMRELNGELGLGFHYLNYGSSYSELLMISKKYEFIKWLVENDKIDLDMVRKKLGIPCCVWYGSGRIIAVKDVEDYKHILMLLAISDTPIEDLLLYLK